MWLTVTIQGAKFCGPDFVFGVAVYCGMETKVRALELLPKEVVHILLFAAYAEPKETAVKVLDRREKSQQNDFGTVGFPSDNLRAIGYTLRNHGENIWQ